MNKIQTIINAVLGVFVITLTVLVVILFTKLDSNTVASNEDYEFEYVPMDTAALAAGEEALLNDTSLEEEEEEVAPEKMRKPKLPIAYVNMDKLNREYKFVIDANARLNSMADKSRKQLVDKYNSLAASLQAQEQDLIKRAQSGQIESEEEFNRQRAELEKKLQKAQQELATMESKLAQENEAELQKQSKLLNKRVNEFLKVYNADGRYELILSNLGEIKDNILYSVTPAYDITDEVVRGLNARYGK
ncbi:MAG: OmpH family outer membrane protein [Paludibacteraceae bacterium]|jgi:outer membrane protein|nr:OmpH family outer membrane protein [Paludibacteraceae bacterium]MBR1717313.1 OmpH family outer membrane protein [Paludibacteraceae bacterium]